MSSTGILPMIHDGWHPQNRKALGMAYPGL